MAKLCPRYSGQPPHRAKTSHLKRGLSVSASQELVSLDAERLGDVEEPFVEQGAAAMLYVDKDVARHSRCQCQLLLSQSRP